MNTALVLAIFIAGTITGMALLIAASLVGEYLRARAADYPRVVDDENGGRLLDFTRAPR